VRLVGVDALVNILLCDGVEDAGADTFEMCERRLGLYEYDDDDDEGEGTGDRDGDGDGCIVLVIVGMFDRLRGENVAEERDRFNDGLVLDVVFDGCDRE
jgi:hypothetical protein